MARGTTGSTAADFTSKSKGARPATGGNKNVQSRARRKSAPDQKSKVAGMFAKTHTGPYLGSKSV